MDPNNPVVKLCAQGMECEGRGRFNDASGLFMKAWHQRADDFERCIAAHYVARHQKNPSRALLWNQRSLDHANAVRDARVREFYPSLYLNIGKVHADLRNHEDAKRFYELAAKDLNSLTEQRYGGIVRDAVRKALLRVA